MRTRKDKRSPIGRCPYCRATIYTTFSEHFLTCDEFVRQYLGVEPRKNERPEAKADAPAPY